MGEIREYLSEKIGNEYRNWRPTDTIFITAPTGSGKTYFVINVLLKYAVASNKRILYVVNRKVLKEQIEEEIKKVHLEIRKQFEVGVNIKNFITVKTYQNLEERFCFHKNGRDEIINEMNHYDYIIYDEAHYFYSDSNFNTYTEVSFDLLRYLFDWKIQIFISATMERVKKIIENRKVYYPWDHNYRGVSLRGCVQGRISEPQILWKSSKIYAAPRDYGFVNMKSIANLKDLPAIVLNNIAETKDKWLIFVDSIQMGKDLCKELEKQCTKKNKKANELIFLDARFREDEEATNTMENIIRKQKSDKRITISTAVMDNGISLHDEELRNIVIVADSEETFVQMLGRKRQDNQTVNLYICQRDEAYFNKRLAEVTNIINFYFDYLTELNCAWCLPDIKNGCKQYLYPAVAKFERDYKWNLYYQQKVLHAVLQSKRAYECMKHLCYVLDGVLCVNTFAVEKYCNLKEFYKEMADEMKKDDTAFLKKQMAWLGKSENENLVSGEEGIDQVYKKQIEDSIEKLLGGLEEKHLNQAKYIEFKMENLQALLFFFKNRDDAFIQGLKKNDRVLALQHFNELMNELELPYKMNSSKVNSGVYIIKKN